MQELMPYLLAVLGFLAVYVLNSIKQEMRDIKQALTALEADMRKHSIEHDRRLTRLEAYNDANHGS